ncbi:CATRA system-associated protein [Saccharothrix deserti]|uniref:CATRA system-associated protein n=1 Tax=Saccharothrix deserti TaxID=2593674 RepID=UPI00131D0CDB|nr:CATRA system-associated protein [Saccharothrix deserti]
MEDDIRDDALSLLREALAWRLIGDRWRAVDRALDGMAAALERGEADAFRRVLHDLELAGPTRVVPIEGASVLPAPEPVRERINQLVHTLAEVDRPDRRSPQDDRDVAAD